MGDSQYQISFNERSKVFSTPTEHIVRLVIKVISITLFLIAAFSHWKWYVILLFALIFGLSFLESKRESISYVTMTFYETNLIVEKTNLVDAFGNRTNEVYQFEYKTKPAVEYSTKDQTVTIRGNALHQKFKCGNIASGGLEEKAGHVNEGPISLTINTNEFNGNIVSVMQDNSPLRVEKISC